MATGKLYNSVSREFIAEVDYRLLSDKPDHWWGELVTRESRIFVDGDSYLIELDDGRKGRCFLRRKINKAVGGLFTRYHYQFDGNSELK